MFTVSETVSDETLNCVITIESNGRPAVKAKTSSATGLGQFIDATWLNTVKKHRPDIFAANSKAEVLAMRTDPSFSIEMLARFTEDNQRIVGMKCSGGDLYLAHFLGAGAAQHVYVADPSTPVELLVSAGAVKANENILRGKTAGQVRAWAAKKMLAAGGHAWVAKYYDEPTEELPEEDIAPEAIPDTQTMRPHIEDSPAAAVKKDDPVAVGEPKERWSAYLFKLVKSKIQWAGTGLGGLSLASISGFFQDWRILAVLGTVAVALVVIIVVERGRKP